MKKALLWILGVAAPCFVFWTGVQQYIDSYAPSVNVGGDRFEPGGEFYKFMEGPDGVFVMVNIALANPAKMGTGASTKATGKPATRSSTATSRGHKEGRRNG